MVAPTSLTFDRVITDLIDDMHTARNLTVAFANLNDDSPALNIGWTCGTMFGVHFAIQYPKLAARMNQLLFKSHTKHFGPTQAADLIAQSIRDEYFDDEATDDTMLDMWTALRDRPVSDMDDHGEGWPV